MIIFRAVLHATFFLLSKHVWSFSSKSLFWNLVKIQTGTPFFLGGKLGFCCFVTFLLAGHADPRLYHPRFHPNKKPAVLLQKSAISRGVTVTLRSINWVRTSHLCPQQTGNMIRGAWQEQKTFMSPQVLPLVT